MREYERTLATALNACLIPALRAHLDPLCRSADERGARFWLMRSSGCRLRCSVEPCVSSPHVHAPRFARSAGNAGSTTVRPRGASSTSPRTICAVPSAAFARRVVAIPQAARSSRRVVPDRCTLPSYYLPFVKGIGELVHFSGTTSYAVNYAIVNTDPLLEVAESTREDWLELFDLTRLSLETRIVLVALMLPFGALLTALFNEVIGIRTYGVFTPTLLALALVYVPWQSAAVVLVVVLLLGVGGRAVIPGELTRVPRLAVVLTLVALGIGASASLMDYFEIGFGGQLVLLPIVILASMVDRFYTLFDEKGLSTALIRLGWTLLLAALCIPIVQYEALGHLLVRYPELHLITLAAILGLTLHSGRRFSQVPGLAWLNWPEKPKF